MPLEPISVPNPDELRRVGIVVRAHGIRGAMVFKIESDFPEWVRQQKSFWVFHHETWGQWQRSSVSLNREGMLLTVKEITSRDEAEAQIGAQLYVPEAEARKVLDEDTFFNSDLVGCTVGDGQKSYGKVVSVLDGPAHPILEIKKPNGKTFLFPFTKTLVPHIDLAQNWIQVDMPEGLDELT
ncbi:MAG: 16S rRNA processing protein RimM [Acidobacteria bacterium]|nr:16S rRNA processing protein RimM [Acidobacteriota bacterium]MCB9398459.1 16S rRNA processing protein RimM [Acidobacteriota bacterium]